MGTDTTPGAVWVPEIVSSNPVEWFFPGLGYLSNEFKCSERKTRIDNLEIYNKQKYLSKTKVKYFFINTKAERIHQQQTLIKEILKEKFHSRRKVNIDVNIHLYKKWRESERATTCINI